MVSPHSKGSTHDSSCIPLIPVPQRPVEGPAHSRCILHVHGTGESSSQCQPPPSLIHSLLLIIRPDVPLAVGALGWGFANPSFRASAKHPHVFSPMLRSPHALGFPNAPGIPPRSVLCSGISLDLYPSPLSSWQFLHAVIELVLSGILRCKMNGTSVGCVDSALHNGEVC